MLKTSNLHALLHTRTGMDMDTIGLYARRLREAGLFVRETKSSASPRATPRHIAHLLIVLLAEEPATRVARTIARADDLKATRESHDHLRIWENPTDDIRFFYKEHSFTDAVEHLVKCAIEAPDWFRGNDDCFFGYSRIDFDRSEFLAEIDLQWMPSSLPRLLRASDVRGQNFSIDYIDEVPIGADPSANRLSRRTIMRFSLFGDIGAAIAAARDD